MRDCFYAAVLAMALAVVVLVALPVFVLGGALGGLSKWAYFVRDFCRACREEWK